LNRSELVKLEKAIEDYVKNYLTKSDPLL
jgi:hypothetical protein